MVWIDEPHRRGGHGEALMRRAEGIARELGCHSVWLDTFSFQAPGFYEKLGYEVFGRLDDFGGHSRFFLRRTLGPTPG